MGGVVMSAAEWITDEAVEKAAQALHDHRAMECRALHEVGQPLRDTVYASERRADARVALEAVAPLIAAKAWEEGYQACRNRPRVDGYLINRANPYQTRADAIERGES